MRLTYIELIDANKCIKATFKSDTAKSATYYMTVDSGGYIDYYLIRGGKEGEVQFKQRCDMLRILLLHQFKIAYNFIDEGPVYDSESVRDWSTEELDAWLGVES